MSIEPWMIVAGGVIGMLISLVLMVIFFIRSQLKAGFIFLFIFFLSLIFLGAGIYYSVKKTFNNLIELGENMGQGLDSLNIQNGAFFRPEKLDSLHVTKQAWQIITCNRDTSVQYREHFDNFGSMIHRRLPLPYPFALIQHEGEQTAELVKEKYHNENDNIEEENLVLGVKKLNCDCKFLMISTTNRINDVQDSEKNEEIKYILFTFDTGKQLFFSNEQELWKKAVALGYEGEKKFLILDEYNALFYASEQ